MGMNVGKSIKLLLIKQETDRAALATYLGVSVTMASNLAGKRHVSGVNIDKLAAFFNMKPSEFIAVGEDDETPRRRASDKA